MNEMLFLVGIIVLQSVALLVALLIVVSFLIYADRKVWAAVQLRRGPNVVGEACIDVGKPPYDEQDCARSNLYDCR